MSKTSFPSFINPQNTSFSLNPNSGYTAPDINKSNLQTSIDNKVEYKEQNLNVSKDLIQSKFKSSKLFINIFNESIWK